MLLHCAKGGDYGECLLQKGADTGPPVPAPSSVLLRQAMASMAVRTFSETSVGSGA